MMKLVKDTTPTTVKTARQSSLREDRIVHRCREGQKEYGLNAVNSGCDMCGTIGGNEVVNW
jgi:hypothetical protein